MEDQNKQKQRRLPDWLKSPLPHGEKYSKVKHTIEENDLNTICTSGNCPNRGFAAVESSPLVRSSYHAEKHVYAKRKREGSHQSES